MIKRILDFICLIIVSIMFFIGLIIAADKADNPSAYHASQQESQDEPMSLFDIRNPLNPIYHW